jgi:hypothetical protein
MKENKCFQQRIAASKCLDPVQTVLKSDLISSLNFVLCCNTTYTHILNKLYTPYLIFSLVYV